MVRQLEQPSRGVIVYLMAEFPDTYGELARIQSATGGDSSMIAHGCNLWPML